MPIRVLFLSVLLCLPQLALGELPEPLRGLGLREAPQPVRAQPGWEKPTRAVVHPMLGEQGIAQLQKDHPGLEIVAAASVAAAVEAIPGAQVLIGYCDQSIFAAADELRWVQVFFAGVENCVNQAGMRSGKLTLTNGQRLSSTALADHAIALMFALQRDLAGNIRSQVRGAWEPEFARPAADFPETSGGTVLVVGLGGIGTQVARRAHGLGMRVVATRGSRREGPDYVSYVGLADEAISLAEDADVVINTAPLTDRTRGMFNAAFFKAMKPSAFFVSVGRGESTVTADLMAALREGEIAGAGLDVTDPEPLPAGHPLWDMPRVIITPHVGWRSLDSQFRVGALVRENLRRYAAGEPLLSVVNIEKGY